MKSQFLEINDLKMKKFGFSLYFVMVSLQLWHQTNSKKKALNKKPCDNKHI